jgi:hypothetical protein
MAEKGLVGDLKSMPLTDVFQWISLSNRTGELVLQSEFETVSVFFVEGRISYSYANNPKFLLGQILLRYKKINKSQLVKALSLQKKIKKPLGYILVHENILDKKELNSIILIQIKEIIYYLLKWDSGFFTFESKESKSISNILLSTDELLMEGMRRLDEEKQFYKFLRPESIPIITDENLTGDIFDLIDGKKCLAEILKIYGMDEFESLEKIYRALREGKIKIDSFKNNFLMENPILKFLVALELFNKGKIYDSYKELKTIINRGYKNEQVIRFFDSLKVYIAKYFNLKYGGNNTCFELNKTKLLDTRLYITPTEGFILSRIEEYPCVGELHKVANMSYEELYLIIDKLYKIGMLFLKSKEQYKSEPMTTDLVESFIKIYKEKLSGELEVITDKGKFYIYLSSGKVKFIYSFSDSYSISSFLSERKQIFKGKVGLDNIDDYLEAALNNNNISLSEFASILEVYQTMIFYEMISHKPISIVLTYNKNIIYDFKTEFNYLYMLAFSIANEYCNLEDDFDRTMSYKLVKEKTQIIKEFGEFEGIKNVLKYFNNSVINEDTLAKLDKKSIYLLKILYLLEYLEASPDEKRIETLEELKKYYKEIKNKTPNEIFNLSKSYSIDELKQKYLKLSKKYHPDLFPDKDIKTLANDIFEIIKSSYDKLKEDKESLIEESNELKVDAKKIFLAEQLFTSGKIYLDMGRLPEAVDAFIKAYENFPDDDEIKSYYGLALIRTGKASNGFQSMKNAKFYEFNDFNLYVAYIDAAIKLGKKSEAKKYIDIAFKKFPESIKKIAALQLKLN